MNRSDTIGGMRPEEARVVVLVAHEEPFVAYSLKALLTARGCRVIGPFFDLRILPTLAIADEPDLILLGDLGDISADLASALRDRFPTACLVAFDSETQGYSEHANAASRARAMGLDCLLTGNLGNRQIISRLQLLLGQRRKRPAVSEAGPPPEICDLPAYCGERCR